VEAAEVVVKVGRQGVEVGDGVVMKPWAWVWRGERRRRRRGMGRMVIGAVGVRGAEGAWKEVRDERRWKK